MHVVGREQFEIIRRRHGGYASWAVWRPLRPTDGPKAGIGDLSIFDLSANPATLSLLRADVIMAGLNISNWSTDFLESLRNFHSPRPSAQDFKIRYAFADTAYYGAYMTDVIKNVPMVKSTDLLDHLRTQPALVGSNIETFREEIRDLRSERPTILAFGAAAHSLLVQSLRPTEYSALVRLTHYSHRISKEDYRETVMAQIRASSSKALSNLGSC